jgi:hypothetical protein
MNKKYSSENMDRYFNDPGYRKGFQPGKNIETKAGIRITGLHYS